MRSRHVGFTIAYLLLLAAAPTPAQDAAAVAPAMVYFADGASQPLSEWTLSYDYISWKSGTSQVLASPTRKQTRELIFGKRSFPAPGAVLEIQFDLANREREVDGKTTVVKVQVAKSVAVTPAGGQRTLLKIEPPQRDLLLPGIGKDMLLLVRSIDFRGQTLTGTKRELCLLSLTSLVECSDKPENQIVKVEFPR